MKSKKIRNILKSGERPLTKPEYTALIKRGIVVDTGDKLVFTLKANRQFGKIQKFEVSRAPRV